MDHAEVRERLEEAAIEPGGLDRLLGGDGWEAMATVDHLAGCDACRADLEALRRSVSAIRDSLQASPPDDLRARTLDYVARVGRPRAADAAALEPVGPGAVPEVGWSLPAWLPAFAGGVAAAALAAIIVVGATVGPRLAEADAAIAEQRAAVAGLEVVSDWALRVGAAPDAARVRLAAQDGGPQAGTVVFSDATDELVMVASGLPEPAAGDEYRCWIESGGERIPIGAMYRAGALAYWVGEVDLPTLAGDGHAFGVTLVPSSSEGVSGDPVLAGES
jgi:Anti-sigma-K factor rskA